MENKEIMEKLLDNGHSATKSEKKILDDFSSPDESSLSKIRVVTAKYKVYLVLLLIGICLLLLEYIPNMADRYNSTELSYNQIQVQLTDVNNKIIEAEATESYLYEIVENEDTLKNCLNEESDYECSLLPSSWKKINEESVEAEESDEVEESVELEGSDKYNYLVPLSYLQLHSLYSVKMAVDEKRVLKNLNEYLIKEDILGNSRTRVGDILSISIGDPELVEGVSDHFFSVPVHVTIKFVTIDDLIGFLYNVEKKLINTGNDRILYKIQTVSYDIIASDEPQITDIGMIAYYYYDERFEDVDAQIKEILHPTENAEDVNSQDDEKDSDNGGSFLDEIFKK